jgi:excisionase family DNA binding protein
MPASQAKRRAAPDLARQVVTLDRARHLPTTLSVAAAARLLGVGRTAAYEAIHRKELPSLRIGRRLVVPTAPLLAMLGLPLPSTTPPHAHATGDHGLAECLRRVGQALFAVALPESARHAGASARPPR